MNWEDLRTFFVIAREGTLSGAARTLGLTQPTLGRRLKALEQRSGARLLDRTPDGFVLTPAGEAVYANAERMDAEAIAIERVVAGTDIRLEGNVRVTTIEIFANTLLLDAAAHLRAVHPGIALEIIPDSRSLSLSKREADIALRMSPFQGNELYARRIGHLRFGAYASRHYLADRPKPDHILTVLEDQRHLEESRWFAERFAGARLALASNSREVLASAAAAGLGIACLPRFRAEREGALRLIDCGEPPRRPIWLGVHGDLRHTPRIRAVLDQLVDAIARAGLG